MVLADIYDLLNDVFFQSVRVIGIAACAGLAIFLGIKLRKHMDAKKKSTEINNADDNGDTTNTTM